MRFTTQAYVNKAASLSINQKTAERYITKLCKDNILIRESQGNYYNPLKENSEETKKSEGTK